MTTLRFEVRIFHNLLNGWEILVIISSTHAQPRAQVGRSFQNLCGIYICVLAEQDTPPSMQLDEPMSSDCLLIVEIACIIIIY